MFGKRHRHDHGASVGVVLAKLALGIFGAVIKNKIANKLTGKTPPQHVATQAVEDRNQRHGGGIRR